MVSSVSKSFDRKREAARHSLDAFSLLQAARYLRHAALILSDMGEDAMAAKVKSVVASADRKRRAMMKRTPRT